MSAACILVALAHSQQSWIGEEFSHIPVQRSLIALEREQIVRFLGNDSDSKVYEALAELIETGVADDDTEDKADVLQIRIDALNDKREAYPLETLQTGGAIISLDYYGRVKIERGFIRGGGQ